MYNNLPNRSSALCCVGVGVTSRWLLVHTARAPSVLHSGVPNRASAVREQLGNGSAQTAYIVLRAFSQGTLVGSTKPNHRRWLCKSGVGDNDTIVRHRGVARVGRNGARSNAVCLTATTDANVNIDVAEGISCYQCRAYLTRTSASPIAETQTGSVRHEMDGIVLRPEQSRILCTSTKETNDRA